MSRWIEAHEAPKAWEGKVVLAWSEHHDDVPRMMILPREFSRLIGHCSGIWVKAWPGGPRPRDVAEARRKREERTK